MTMSHLGNSGIRTFAALDNRPENHTPNTETDEHNKSEGPGPGANFIFGAISPCFAKISSACSRQPFIPASSDAASHGRSADIGQTMTPSSLRAYA